MLLHLNRIPVMWLTCSKTVEKRRAGLIDSLQKIGVENAEEISGPITDPYSLGVAENYLEALTRHSPPFFILEDDARLISENRQTRFLIPSGTDALYLGTSTYGRQRGLSSDSFVVAAEETPEFFRIFNMLGLHAVVYLSSEYVEHVARVMKKYLKNPVGACDDGVADSMHRYRVLCWHKPVFFQNDGKSNICTSQPINPMFRNPHP